MVIIDIILGRISKGSHIKFVHFVLLAVNEEDNT